MYLNLYFVDGDVDHFTARDEFEEIGQIDQKPALTIKHLYVVCSYVISVKQSSRANALFEYSHQIHDVTFQRILKPE